METSNFMAKRDIEHFKYESGKAQNEFEDMPSFGMLGPATQERWWQTRTCKCGILEVEFDEFGQTAQQQN